MDEEEFNQFYRPKMDHSISNVGVRATGAVNMFVLQMFLGRYLSTEETAIDFLRVKAVLDIKESDQMYVIQCVHMLRNQSFTKFWPKGEPRENRIIFIGRGMQQRRQELTEGFMACIAQPLRFNIGARIRAKVGPDQYMSGVVIKHWDEYHPYRLRLCDGDEVHAPLDDDAFVMAMNNGGPPKQPEAATSAPKLSKKAKQKARRERAAANNE